MAGYKDAQAIDLIDLDIITRRLDTVPHAGQAGRRKLFRLLAERELIFEKLARHGMKHYACLAVYDPPKALAEIGYKAVVSP